MVQKSEKFFSYCVKTELLKRLCFHNCNYMLFTKLFWPEGSEGTFQLIYNHKNHQASGLEV